jgi:hypothetical protein
MDLRHRSARWRLLLILAYAVLMVLIVGSLLWARRWAIAEMATPESIGDWQAWRADVRDQQHQPSPVARRVPKSAEPPTLVLLRDYFAVMMVGAVLFSSVLYWLTAWLVVGMLSAPDTKNHR